MQFEIGQIFAVQIQVWVLLTVDGERNLSCENHLEKNDVTIF